MVINDLERVINGFLMLSTPPPSGSGTSHQGGVRGDLRGGVKKRGERERGGGCGTVEARRVYARGFVRRAWTSREITEEARRAVCWPTLPLVQQPAHPSRPACAPVAVSHPPGTWSYAGGPPVSLSLSSLRRDLHGGSCVGGSLCLGRGEGGNAEGREAQLTRFAALARFPLHDASVHVARALGLGLRGLLECVAHVRRADVRVLEVGNTDVPPGGHGRPACETSRANSKRRGPPTRSSAHNSAQERSRRSRAARRIPTNPPHSRPLSLPQPRCPERWWRARPSSQQSSRLRWYRHHFLYGEIRSCCFRSRPRACFVCPTYRLGWFATSELPMCEGVLVAAHRGGARGAVAVEREGFHEELAHGGGRE